MKMVRIASSQGSKVAALVAMTLGGIGFISVANAALITPGQTINNPPGLAVYGGVAVFPSTTTPFIGTSVLGAAFTGELTSTVYSDPANVFGAGDYDFVYQFSNDNNPNNDAIENFSINGFGGYSTNADYSAGSNVAPVQITRLAPSLGDVINYYFGSTSGVPYSKSSDQLVIQTNATSYQFGTASLQDGGTARISAPVPSVPEPATFAIASFAVCALGMRRRAASKA